MSPAWDKAEIPVNKLSNYLLSRTHPKGRHKARQFRSLGYRDPESLRADIMTSIREPVLTDSKEHGSLYRVQNSLISPNGTPFLLRTIWHLAHGESTPRLVTAYPV